MPLANAEGDVDAKAKSSRLSDAWQADKMSVPAIYDRGQKTINSVYGKSLLGNVFTSYGSHKEDFKFTEIFTLYGLYLSECP
ncbi:hypothetical protein LTR46_011051 [Exophiala xenobiotica]|nr:hypothetical protein LTR46_011051 [Exophiala xenobiotica]